MNFLRSVFSDSPPQSPPPSSPNPAVDSPTSSGWNLTSLLDSYSRDLTDFSSAFRHDTSLISRSLLPLPLSLDHAQHSLESVGQAIDDLGSLLLSHGKLALSTLDHDPSSSSSPSSPVAIAPGGVVSSEKYSRHAAQLSAIQGDAGTYLDEPDDGAGFASWKLGFVLDDREEEIERLLSGDGVVRSIYETVVPREVQRDVFWERYFYRVYKLDKAEDARARLVQRAMTGEDDENDLRWDFEEEVEEDNGGSKIGGGSEIDSGRDDGGRPSISDAVESNRGKSGEKEAQALEKDSGGDSSCKDSDLSIISSQPSMPEVEDLGWDEIEDVNDEDKKAKVKPAEGVSMTRKDELRNRLSSAAEDDELSWDIEDEDGSHHP